MKSKYKKLIVFVLCFICTLTFDWFNKSIGSEITFVLIYFIPISVASWFAGIFYGIVIGLLCSFSWLFVFIDNMQDLLLRNMILANNVITLNILLKFLIMIGYTILLGSLKQVLEQEKAISRIDNLTEVANGRAFLEALDKEIDRSTRHERIISLIYMDLDNFKSVNDTHGHTIGDKALKETAKTLNLIFRSSDTVARLGGDEFTVLLPETDNVSAMTAAEKLRVEFKNMSERNQWLISLSIGVATFTTPPKNSDEIIKFADDLMYSAKQNGKNNIKTGTMVKW